MSKRKTWQWWAAGWLGFIGVVALVAPWLPLPFEPAAPDLMHMSTPPLRGAADGHWLGTVPRLLLVVAVAAGGRLSPAGLLLLLTLTSWASPARLVRAETLRIRQLPFVEAGRASGLPAGRLWLRHVLPAALRPLRVELPLSLASLLVLESTISFLGIGLPPDVASWGRLISAARLDSASWWTAAFPVATLMLTIAALRVLAQSPAAAE